MFATTKPCGYGSRVALRLPGTTWMELWPSRIFDSIFKEQNLIAPCGPHGSPGDAKHRPETRGFAALLGRSCWKEASGGLRDGLELDVKAELFKTSNELAGLEFDGAPIKVGAAEVMVFDAVFEDMVDGGEDRCGNGADSFLRPTLALQPEELGPVVAVFLALGGPGALHQHGLEPGGSLAQARRFALAGAFVVPRTQPGPGDEVPGGWKAAHIAADLGHDGAGRYGTDPGDRAQKLDQGTKGDLAAGRLRMHASDPLIDFAIDLADRLIQPIPLLQVQVEEKAVVICQPPMQRVVEFLRRRLDLLAGKRGQLTRLANTIDHRFDHPSPACAHDVADDRVELDIGFSQCLLDPLDMPRLLADQLLAGPRQRTQLLDLLIRDKAGLDQPAGQQVGDPRRVVHVGLAPGDVLDVRRICHHQLKRPLAENPEHRHPIDAGRLHRHIRAPAFLKPRPQLHKLIRRGRKGPALPLRLAFGYDPDTSDHRVLVHV